MSDMTSLQLGLLAHGGGITWAGPLACDDFGRSAADGGVDDVTEGCFVEAMSGALEAVGFRTDAGFDGLDVRGTLWGGNLAIVNSLLATPHWPRVKGGILFVEDVNEHPYRVERNLLQLHQAGVLDAQKAIVLGAVSGWRKSPIDRGYSLASMLARVRAATRTPILTGLPFGHVATKVTLAGGRESAAAGRRSPGVHRLGLTPSRRASPDVAAQQRRLSPAAADRVANSQRHRPYALSSKPFACKAGAT